MNSKSCQKNQKCRPQCKQPRTTRYPPGTITGLMSTEKPPDMQIRLASIYCPAECQFTQFWDGWAPRSGFPNAGFSYLDERQPQAEPQLRGRPLAPTKQQREHQHHCHHFGPLENYRRILILHFCKSEFSRNLTI